MSIATEAGKELLARDGMKAEWMRGRTCLVCEHFKTREKTTVAYCAVRPRITVNLGEWSHPEREAARKRPSQAACRFIDMRPKEEVER